MASARDQNNTKKCVVVRGKGKTSTKEKDREKKEYRDENLWEVKKHREAARAWETK